MIFSDISYTQLSLVAIFDFLFRSTAAPPQNMATSTPDEYSKSHISTTINPRDSIFGRFMEDNECSNFAFNHVDRFASRDQKFGQRSET